MSESRNERKTYRGRVVSDKMNKTITVAVETTKKTFNLRKADEVHQEVHGTRRK